MGSGEYFSCEQGSEGCTRRRHRGQVRKQERCLTIHPLQTAVVVVNGENEKWGENGVFYKWCYSFEIHHCHVNIFSYSRYFYLFHNNFIISKITKFPTPTKTHKRGGRW